MPPKVDKAGTPSTTVVAAANSSADDRPDPTPTSMKSTTSTSTSTNTTTIMMDDDASILREIIAELVTENASLKHDNARLKEDNRDLAEQAVHYLAHMTSSSSSQLETMNGSGSTIGSSSGIGSDKQLGLYQRTIEELKTKIMVIVEEKVELVTRLEFLEHQLMMTTSNGGGGGGRAVVKHAIVPEKTKTTSTSTTNRGFLPGIFFSARSFDEDEEDHHHHPRPPAAATLPRSQSDQHSGSSATMKKDFPSVTVTPTKNGTSTTSRELWNRQREDLLFSDMEGLTMKTTTTTTTSHNPLLQRADSQQTDKRASLFSGRFGSIYNDGNDPGELTATTKKPVYFGTTDKQQRNQKKNHRISTAAAMVEEEDGKYMNRDDRTTGVTDFNLLL